MYWLELPLKSIASVAELLAIVTNPLNVALVPVSAPDSPNVPPVALPNTGVTKVGEVANTATPVPVSSVKEVASCAEVIEPVAVPYSVPCGVEEMEPVAVIVLLKLADVPVNAPAKLNVEPVMLPLNVEMPFTFSEPVIMALPVNVCVFAMLFPNTLLPLEYMIEDVMV